MADTAPIRKLLDQTRQELARLDRQRDRLLIQEETFALAVAAMDGATKKPAASPAAESGPRSTPVPAKAGRGRKAPTKRAPRTSTRWNRTFGLLAALNRPFTYSDMISIAEPMSHTHARTKMFGLRRDGLVETVGRGAFRLTPKGIEFYVHDRAPPKGG